MKLPFLNQSDASANSATQGSAWSDALPSPETRSMLLQTGLALLSGGGGGNIGQQLGHSLGQGFEARDRVIANDQAAEARSAEQAMKQAGLALDQEGMGLRREQLKADVANAQAARQIDQAQLKISQQNADTARLSATKPVGTASQLADERANRSAWMKFATTKVEEAQLNDVAAPTLAEIAAEYEALGGVVPSTLPRAQTQAAAAPAANANRKQVDGKWYVNRDGKWFAE